MHYILSPFNMRKKRNLVVSCRYSSDELTKRFDVMLTIFNFSQYEKKEKYGFCSTFILYIKIQHVVMFLTYRMQVTEHGKRERGLKIGASQYGHRYKLICSLSGMDPIPTHNTFSGSKHALAVDHLAVTIA